MIDLTIATRTAKNRLDQSSRESGGGGEFLITSITEYPDGWLFQWNNSEAVAGDLEAGVVGNWPLFVFRTDGRTEMIKYYPWVEGDLDAKLQALWQR